MSTDTGGGNLERFSGLADFYDANRPAPPLEIIALLTQYAGGGPIGLVVDIGSGTGLSSRLWQGASGHVIAIEPNADMRRRASERGGCVEYRDGQSTATGLAEGCADIVTCSQALHWMDPSPTFAEIARILRPGGVFAAYDCDWPPAICPAIDSAYQRFDAATRLREKELSAQLNVRKWSKDHHLDRMQESGRFSYTREVLLHHIESGDAGRIVGIAQSQGGCAALLRSGVTEEQLGLTHLREVALEALGNRTVPWYWSYRIRIGVK